MKKPKVSLSKRGISDFFLNHGEKLVVGLFAMLSLGLVWGGVDALRTKPVTRELLPQVMTEQANRSREHISREKTPPPDTTKRPTLATVMEPWRQPSIADRPPATVFNRPIIEQRNKRSKPEVYPIERLIAVPGQAVVALKPDEAAALAAAAAEPRDDDGKGKRGTGRGRDNAPGRGTGGQADGGAADGLGGGAVAGRGGGGAAAGVPGAGSGYPGMAGGYPGGEMGGGMMGAGAPANPVGRVVPYCVVLGLVPWLKQTEDFQERFMASSLPNPQGDQPVWADYLVERAEVGPDGLGPWKKIDLRAAWRQADKLYAGIERDQLPADFILTQEMAPDPDPSRTTFGYLTPLPQLAGDVWGLTAVHPWCIETILERQARQREWEKEMAEAAKASSTALRGQTSGGMPGMPGGYPGGAAGMPGGYPGGAAGGIPGGIPGGDGGSMVSADGGGYPGGGSGYPAGGAGYPGGGSGYPGGGSGYPGGAYPGPTASAGGGGGMGGGSPPRGPRSTSVGTMSAGGGGSRGGGGALGGGEAAGGVPPSMGGMMGGMMGAGMGMPGAMGPGGDGRPAEPTEYRLFRFIDYTVEPGKSYTYRVRVSVFNPNYDMPAAHLADVGLAKDLKIASETSNESAPVAVPRGGELLARTLPSKDAKRLKGGVEVILLGLDPADDETTIGSSALRSVITDVGGFANVDKRLNKGGDQRARGEDLATDALLVDVRGRQEERSDSKVKEPAEPFDLLFLRSDGSLELVVPDETVIPVNQFIATLSGETGAQSPATQPGPFGGGFGNPYGGSPGSGPPGSSPGGPPGGPSRGRGGK